MKLTRRMMTKGVVASAALAVGTPVTMLAQMNSTPESTPMHGGGMDAGTGTSAAYMHITNNGPEADTLIGASTDIAEVVEIHTMEMDGNVMKMMELEDGLEIPAGETVTLERGGYHVMLINLTQALNEGDVHKLTLQFENAGEIELEVVVSNNAPEDEETEFEGLVIASPHIRPAPMLDGTDTDHGHGSGTGTSAAYMLITNNGSDADVLIGGRSDAAEIVEIHTMEMDGDVMKMMELEDGLEIPAGETVTLERGGYHIMLINLTRDMHDGDEIALTLEFENAGEVELAVPVTMDIPEGDPIVHGDLEITAAHARPAPMLSDGGASDHGEMDDMEATPDSH